MLEKLNTAIQEIEGTKAECLGLIETMKNFCPPDAKGNYNETFRLLAIPLLYSAWERCFTLCHAVALRLIRDATPRAELLPANERALWLLSSRFFSSLAAKLQNQGAYSDRRGPGKGHFDAVCDFLGGFDLWRSSVLDPAANTDDLVMTLSNVNPEVVEMNARSIGIDGFPTFKALKFGRLHDLVGRRNEIGHGAIIRAPENQVYRDLEEFTTQLIGQYADVFVVWLRNRFASEEQPLPG